MFRLTPTSVEPITLSPLDRLKFADDAEWWTVRAVTPNFAALTREVSAADRQKFLDDQWEAEHPDELEGDVFYTVIDWANGWRGPCNLIGQSWGDGSYSETECDGMLAEFESGEIEVSHRNNVRIEIAEVSA